MKITKIKIAETQSVEIKGSAAQDFCLYIFKNPVIISVDTVKKSCPKGTVILYQDGVSRSFHGSGYNSLKYDMVQFRASSADKQYIGGLDIPMNKPIETEDNYILSSNVKNLYFQYQTAGKRSAEVCELYIRIILIALEEACTGRQREICDIPRYSQLKEIRKEIYDNPQQRISVDTLCRRLAVGRSYFHKIYHEAFGVTYRQDEIKSRMAYACKLLTETNTSVSVIAEKCGYETESFFMRQFRQQMGCTPTEYRRKVL
ncbi:MAG: helix-turn-helix transcriptional regulator [Ruminococcus sp.]|nr:helix-turn-helix transcriptional regulator [Ruminococcus sp.]